MRPKCNCFRSSPWNPLGELIAFSQNPSGWGEGSLPHSKSPSPLVALRVSRFPQDAYVYPSQPTMESIEANLSGSEAEPRLQQSFGEHYFSCENASSSRNFHHLSVEKKCENCSLGEIKPVQKYPQVPGHFCRCACEIGAYDLAFGNISTSRLGGYIAISGCRSS